MNLAEVINKAKRFDFDNIISNAKMSENRMYNIEYGQSLFKVKRRDCKRLHLVCKKDEGCSFSIVYGITKCKTMTELHTCSVSKLLKKHVSSGTKSTSNITSSKKTECLTPTTADSSLILFLQTVGTSSVEIVYSGISSMISSDNINDADSPPPSTADFIWSSNDNCTTPLIPKPETSCAMSSPTSTYTSVEVVHSGSSSMISSENINDANSPLPSTADFISSSITEKSSSHSTLAPPRTITDSAWSSNKPSCAIFSRVVTESQKFLEDIISVIDTKDYTSDQKIQLSSRVEEILKTKCGFNLFREIFRACPLAERNDMIFQLQMINSMKKDFEESRRKQWSDFLQEEIQPLKRYRKDKFDYNDDDEDEVTYLDIK
jgi:hypothetical protein